MKHFILVIMLVVGALSANAQGAKVTINDTSAVVTMNTSYDKAIKLAVNKGVVSRTDSQVLVTSIDGNNTVFVVEYNGKYTVSYIGKYNGKMEVIDNFESTRVADIREKIFEWLEL